MDLWIRSQDKENLIKIIAARRFENMIQVRTDNTAVLTVGTYATKERAMEILDDIQEHINVKINVKNISTDLADLYIKGAILDSMHKIYEMPKE